MRRLLVLVSLFLLACGYYWRVDGFFPFRIAVPLLASKDPISSYDGKIPNVFHYLGKGHQVYAFESSGLVLKLFKKSHFNNFFNAFAKQERVRIYPESYPLALKQLQEETGVLLVHLGHSDVSFPVVQVIDRVGKSHPIDLNRVPFVLQKKGERPFFDLLQNSPKEERALLIQAFCAFHQKRIDLCIADYDRDIEHNYCWNQSSLQYIDPARMFYDPSLCDVQKREKEWWRATHRLQKWLEQEHPEEVASHECVLKIAQNPGDSTP